MRTPVRDNAGVTELVTLGWDDAWSSTFAPLRELGLVPGRVAIQHRGEYDVLTAEGEVRARITNRLRRGASPVDLPVVGDWVGLDRALDRRGRATPDEALAPRRTR